MKEQPSDWKLACKWNQNGLHNLGGPVQNKIEEPFLKTIENFSMVTIGHEAKHKALVSMGP